MLRRRTIFLALAAVAPIAATRSAPWIELKRAHYSVFYERGFERDARFVSTWADSAEALMKAKYGVTPRDYRMSVYLFSAPTDTINVSTARNKCCTTSDGGVKTGKIEMLAPSTREMQSVTAISSLGLPKNSEDYHAKVLMSEYIPIGHWSAQAARPTGGWEYYSAPNWFVQGLQEYDAIFHTTEANRTVTATRLADWAVAHKDAFACCSPGITMTDDYNGGATFLRYLAAQFGEDVHARILRSTAPTFDEALAEVTRPNSREKLFARFKAWIGTGAR